MWLPLLGLCALCGLAAAQGPVPTDPGSPAPGQDSSQNAAPADPGSMPPSDDPGQSASPSEAPRETAMPGEHKPMTIDDARLNFGTVVETFIAARSRHGYWPLTQKSSGRTLRLKYEAVESKTVRQVEPGHFSGRVMLRDAESGRPVKAEFFVDFTGNSWSVERLRLLPGPSTGGAKSRKAVKKGPSQEAPPAGDAGQP